MELGNFQKSVDSDEIKTMAFEIIGKPVKAVSRICEQWGEAEDEVREYDVYVIEWEEDIDAERAEAAKHRAEQALANGGLTDKEYRIAEAKLQRALVRLSVKE